MLSFFLFLLWCTRASKQHLDCVGSYRTCLSSPFEISILNVLTREMRAVFERFCLNKETRDTFVAFFACFEGMSDLLDKLATRVVRVMHFVSQLSDVDDVIDAVCCAHQVLAQEDDMISSAYCPIDTKSINGSPLNLHRSALPSHMMCSKYKDIAYCEKHHLNMTSEIRFITLDGILPGPPDDTETFSSPFVYFLQILFKLQE